MESHRRESNRQADSWTDRAERGRRERERKREANLSGELADDERVEANLIAFVVRTGEPFRSASQKQLETSNNNTETDWAAKTGGHFAGRR